MGKVEKVIDDIDLPLLVWSHTFHKLFFIDVSMK
jgi:hypothetical protein